MTNKTWTLLAAVLGSSAVFLDSAVLTVALPAIGREPRLFLDVLEAQNYVQFGYLLSLSSLLVLAGALSDFFGRRLVFVIGLIGFGGTSLLCALAPNLEVLVLARILQGAAGAVLVPGSLAILTNTFEGEEQGRAFGVWAAATGVAPIFGPLVGGLLVDNLSWRWVFLLNVPFTALAVWAAMRHGRESRDAQASGNFDWLGAVLVALAVGGLSFGSIYGQQRQWQDPLAFVALGVGAITTIALPFYFRWARNPLVPLGMFRSRNFSVTNVSTLLIYGALYVSFFFLPLFTQGTLGYSATAIGLGSIPGTVFLIFLSTRFGAIAARLGPRWFMAVGPLLMAVALFWLARIPADSTPWQLTLGDSSTWLPPTSYWTDVFPSYVVFGIGISIMVAPLTTALMRSVPGRQAGLASAINNAVSRVGPQLAAAVIFIVISTHFYRALEVKPPYLDSSDPGIRSAYQPLNPPPADVAPSVARAVRDASTESFHLAMVTAAGLLVLGACVNGLWISNRQALAGAEGPREEPPAPDSAGG